MPTSSRSKQLSPNYLIRRSLLSNPASLFGLGIILIATLVALLGYLIMPDQTPNANDGAVQIGRKPPGYTINLLKIRKNLHVPDRNVFHMLLYGQESPYVLLPFEEYYVEKANVFVRPIGRASFQSFPLADVVHPIYVAKTNLLGDDGAKWKYERDTISWVTIDGAVEESSLGDLTFDFEEENVITRRFWLGTDKSGRDMLSRLMFGTRISLSIGLISVVISMVLGIVFGAVGGFFGKFVDRVIQWFMSVVWAIPGIMLVIGISLALESRGVWVAFLAVGLTMWVEVARVVRGQILSVKEKLYVEAARAIGLKNVRIIIRHMLPNISGPLIVIATSNFAAAILLEAGLSFLGLSVQPPTPSWGIMIYEGYNSIGATGGWHLILFPGLAISMMVLAFNLLGNGLRDAFDPKTISVK